MEAENTLSGSDRGLIQGRDLGARKVTAVEMEGRVLNLRSVLELQLMELSHGCEVKRSKGSLWFGLNTCRMPGPFTGKKTRT